MKKITLTCLCALLLISAFPASAQSDNPRRNHNILERILNQPDTTDDNTDATTTPAPEPTPTVRPATTTPPTQTPDPEEEEDTTPIVPAPIDPKPEPTPPTPDPVPPAQTPAPQTPEPTPSTDGASADPDVLAAQNSSPTAGAGNVYRGKTLPAGTTSLLLAVALSLGIAGALLAEQRTITRAARALLPAPLARSGV